MSDRGSNFVLDDSLSGSSDDLSLDEVEFDDEEEENYASRSTVDEERRPRRVLFHGVEENDDRHLSILTFRPNHLPRSTFA